MSKFLKLGYTLGSYSVPLKILHKEKTSKERLRDVGNFSYRQTLQGILA